MKIAALSFALIVLSSFIGAAVVREFSFRDQGYEDFYISGVDTEKCTNFEFIYPGDINGQTFQVLSLKANLAPVPKSTAKITVLFNDAQLSELRYMDFKDKLVRIEVPSGKMKESNSVRVCGRTSYAVNNITIYADSKFGVYSGAYFPEDRGYRMDLETYEPYVGVPFKITAVAHNYGAEDATVTLSYRKQELERAAPEVSVLEGETSKTGTVPGCLKWDTEGTCEKPGEFSISYFIVAHEPVPFTLLPSVMKFVNVFGEEQTMLTNRPNLGAIEPPHKLSAKVALSNDKLYSGSVIPLTITVQNVSKERVDGIIVKADTGLDIPGEAEKNIGSLEQGQSQDVVFTVKGLNEGTYAVGCGVEYQSRTLECESTNVRLQKGLGIEIISSVLLALLALAVFAYFYFKKE